MDACVFFVWVWFLAYDQTFLSSVHWKGLRNDNSLLITPVSAQVTVFRHRLPKTRESYFEKKQIQGLGWEMVHNELKYCLILE